MSVSYLAQTIISGDVVNAWNYAIIELYARNNNDNNHRLVI